MTFSTSQLPVSPDAYSPRRVVILGAGFAGLQLAQRLAHTEIEVILIDRQNHHTFQPLLHQVATGTLEPAQMTYPIRPALRRARNVRFVLADVIAVRSENQQVETSVGWFDYDYLVIATGSRPQLAKVPGAMAQALPLKTVGDAIAIHQQVLHRFEQASHSTHGSAEGSLTFAIVGGGTTGVELAAALSDWIHHSLIKDFPHLNCHQIRLVLLHSRGELLSGFLPQLQRYAKQQLRQQGVEVRLPVRVHEVTAAGLYLSDGDFIPAHTVIWTAGVQASAPLATKQDAIGKPIAVLPTLQSTHDPHTYALGDVAHIHGQPLPMLAAVAVQQARTVAQNLLREARGQRPQPFRYQPLGHMAILGRYAAVVQMGPLSLTGPLAWWVWLSIHVALLRGRRQRLLTLWHWGLSYGFREQASQVIW